MSSVVSASSSTSSTSTTDLFNGKIFGLQSGLDVDSMVTGMVSDIQSQIDKANQSKQKLQWKQTAYQNIVTALTTFNDSFLALSGAGSLTATDALQTYTAASDNSALVTAKATTGATGAAKNITVYQSAAAATVSNVSAAKVAGTLDTGSLAAGSSFNVTIDGVTKKVTLTSDDVTGLQSTDSATASAALNTAINKAFGYTGTGGIVEAAVTKTSADAGSFTIDSASGFSSWITLSSVSSDALGTGETNAIGSGVTLAQNSNRLDLNSLHVSDVFDAGAVPSPFDENGDIKLNVNGVDVTLNKDDTLYQAVSKINNAGTGVKIAYNSTTGTVSATASNTGAAYSFQLVQGSTTEDNNAQTLLSRLGFDSTALATDDTGIQKGRDAIFSLDGGKNLMTRTADSFTIDGVNYTINGDVSYVTETDSSGTITYQGYEVNGQQQASGAAPSASITFTQDTSTAVKNIQNFVSAYNALLSAVTTAIDTKPDSDYAPLTDAQKEKMSDTDISNWNNKAQQGILYNDDTLQSLEQGLRDMVGQQVTTSDGTTITLGDLGIREDTSNDYTTAPGKLVFDNGSTDTLTAMLQNHPQEVQDLFTKQSNYAYLIDDTGTVTQNGNTVSRQTARKNEEGIAYRLQDIISDFTATNGSALLQGKLTKIIGSADDGDATNSVYDQLTAINDKITDYQAKMTKKKNQLYSKFSLLESMMAKFNSQSGAITSLMSSGG